MGMKADILYKKKAAQLLVLHLKVFIGYFFFQTLQPRSPPKLPVRITQLPPPQKKKGDGRYVPPPAAIRRTVAVLYTCMYTSVLLRGRYGREHHISVAVVQGSHRQPAFQNIDTKFADHNRVYTHVYITFHFYEHDDTTPVVTLYCCLLYFSVNHSQICIKFPGLYGGELQKRL